MQYTDLVDLLEHIGKDPSRLIFEDELTGIHNRRFLLSYLEHKVRWERDDDYPLSLLMIDLDQFKQINDQHGHDTGDQALTWMATLLREVGGEQALPIRYGGDEFMLLLPKSSRREAREMGDRLLQRCRDRPFRLRDADLSVPISLSIGFATAPEDATTAKGLFQAADTALFHAKQSGRNQSASASEVDPEKVFQKTALYRLKATGIAGRDEEMSVVSEALQDVTRGENHVLVVEAAPGMGKTTFVEAVRRNLAGDDTFCTVKVSGDQKEAYRPYYLASRILVAMLNQRDDKGLELIKELSKEEVGFLARVLPQFGDEIGSLGEGDGAARQGLFATLAGCLPRAADFRPQVVLIDDLHLADEATLLLLRVLAQRKKAPLLVCGSSTELLKLSGEEDASPLERFCTAQQAGLEVRRVTLQPLNEEAISEYLKTVFPRLRTPECFMSELARITGGNPLFLGEIIRKLVHDGRVSLIGQDWVVEEIEEGYLPRSLEEIVMQKIADLDEEGRELLERASTMGEDVSLSTLTGSAEMDESKVLEFLDRAEALGLVSLDFQVNDEIMRFLGKRVLEISYGAIEGKRREELHEKVGAYQEGLYQKRLLPSASLLAYHFKRSANQEKARRWEQAQLDFSKSVFDADEAAQYTTEALETEEEEERRLDPKSVPRVPYVLRTFMSAVRNIQLYPPESKTISDALRDVHEALEVILDMNERLHLSQAQRVLLANGQRLEVSRFHMLANSFLKLLTRFELQGIIFRRGVTRDEIRALLMALGTLKPEAIHQGFWRSFSLEHRLETIELRQVRYSRLRRKKGRVALRQPVAQEEELGPQELAHVPKIIRLLQGAAQNARLYPMESRPVARSLEQLHEALQGVLSRRQVLTLARADRSLLVNGAKVDTAGYAPLASNLIELLDSAGITSITFSANIPQTELHTFIDALREPPASGADAYFWEDFAKEKRLAHLAFNQRHYAAGVVESLLGSVEFEVEEEELDESETAELAQQMLEKPAEALRDALPRFGKELLVRGEQRLMQRLLKRLFEGFPEQDPRDREITVLGCRALLDGLILGLQHKLTELSVDHLLGALENETEPRVLQELATALYGMANCALYFADYQAASRILMEVKSRQEALERTHGGHEGLARILDRRLDSTAQQLLKEDLTSGQPERQERAAQVIGSLGRPSIPLLVEAIKDEKDYRVRQMAARLLAELGPEAGDQLKRAMVTEVTVEQRFRILEVIDTVTRDLRGELAFSFGDASPKIRRAAFRLFERLHNDSLIDVILPLASAEESSVAKGAIRSLAHLRSAAAVDALAGILEETDDPKIAVACCQALGELGQSACIDHLARVLSRRKGLFRRRRWDEQTRATAALALKQIEDRRAAKVLSRYAKDRHLRVRQVASS
ncbi:MAG: diguanylate cyclase [Gemmatimonadota bacterium]|nr:MAG: diguanylate cyclase [Gemmatimonadota bacterium]